MLDKWSEQMVISKYIYGSVIVTVFVLILSLAFAGTAGRAEANEGHITITNAQTELDGCVSHKRYVVMARNGSQPANVYRHAVEEFTSTIKINRLTPGLRYAVMSRIACKGENGGLSTGWKNHGTITALSNGGGHIVITNVNTNLEGCVAAMRAVGVVYHQTHGQKVVRVELDSFESFDGTIKVDGLVPGANYSVKSRIACKGTRGGQSTSWKNHGTITAVLEGEGYVLVLNANANIDGCVEAMRVVGSARNGAYGRKIARVELESFDDFDGKVVIGGLARKAEYSVNTRLVCKGENGALTTPWKRHGSMEAKRIGYIDLNDVETELTGCVSDKRIVTRAYNSMYGVQTDRHPVEEFSANARIDNILADTTYAVRSRIACKGADGALSTSWKAHGNITPTPK